MILITGGTGYIGSHACVALAEAGLDVLLLDNLSNSTAGVVDRLQQICGVRPKFIQGDIRSSELLEKVFRDNDIAAVMHFAGLKSVGESVEKPLEYYENNVVGTHSLLKAMERAGTKTLVFSSSATVYGDPEHVPIAESARRLATNPYGRTKLVVEDMLAELCQADPTWSVARLRYFNPVGAHVSGLIGESPLGVPNNLMPYISQVAIGRRDKLFVFGGDYPTLDGTGVRDYIHVMDLVEGHVAALRHVQEHQGLMTANLGTGTGYSVLQMIAAFERASGRRVPMEIIARRAGDAAQCWADTSHAAAILGWTAKRDIAQMCADTWHWQQKFPDGGQ